MSLPKIESNCLKTFAKIFQPTKAPTIIEIYNILKTENEAFFLFLANAMPVFLTDTDNGRIAAQRLYGALLMYKLLHEADVHRSVKELKERLSETITIPCETCKEQINEEDIITCPQCKKAFCCLCYEDHLDERGEHQ